MMEFKKVQKPFILILIIFIFASMINLPITYGADEVTYEWVKIEEDVAGQYYLYLVKNGQHVAGTATITTISGKTVEVSIPVEGVMYVKDVVASITNIKVAGEDNPPSEEPEKATGSIQVTVDKNNAIKGNVFTITITGLSNEKITDFKATLSYDKTKLKIKDKTAGTNFTDLSQTDSEIQIKSSTDVKENSGVMYTIIFEVLSTAEEGTTKIDITNANLTVIDGNSQSENINLENESVTVEIKKDDTVVGEPNGGNNNVQGEKPSNGNEASKNQSLPQTGKNWGTFLTVVIGVILAVTFFLSYKKYKDI